jgi:hypothetical protein
MVTWKQGRRKRERQGDRERERMPFASRGDFI